MQKRFKSAYLNFNPISGHLSILRLRMKILKLTIINTHADEEEKEEFYALLV